MNLTQAAQTGQFPKAHVSFLRSRGSELQTVKVNKRLNWKCSSPWNNDPWVHGQPQGQAAGLALAHLTKELWSWVSPMVFAAPALSRVPGPQQMLNKCLSNHIPGISCAINWHLFVLWVGKRRVENLLADLVGNILFVSSLLFENKS